MSPFCPFCSPRLDWLYSRMLLATRQTASLRKDETLEVCLTHVDILAIIDQLVFQVTAINLLLRSYLAQHQYDQADKLIAKSAFQGAVNQAQSVRWLFYAGRLRAVQLNYAQARTYLQGAIRRAPKDELAPGFIQIVRQPAILL